jgi:hypothetical protein
MHRVSRKHRTRHVKAIRVTIAEESRTFVLQRERLIDRKFAIAIMKHLRDRAKASLLDGVTRLQMSPTWTSAVDLIDNDWIDVHHEWLDLMDPGDERTAYFNQDTMIVENDPATTNNSDEIRGKNDGDSVPNDDARRLNRK